MLLLLAGWEVRAPRRQLVTSRRLRWASNLGLLVLNTVAIRVLLAFGAVGIAPIAHERSWRLFNNISWPARLAIPLSVIALDLALYLQHVMFHAVPALWRLHMVHHADLDFDVTTGLRFHTVEVLLSMGIKVAAIVVLGPPAVAVLIFEVLLNATSMFNHSNIWMPSWLDRIVRMFIVTPDMHRVHHSLHPHETNSNFGFNLPWWDYLLGTYRAQPNDGHEKMTIGLKQFRDDRVDRLHWMLALPFLGSAGVYPINRERTREHRSFTPNVSNEKATLPTSR